MIYWFVYMLHEFVFKLRLFATILRHYCLQIVINSIIIMVILMLKRLCQSYKNGLITIGPMK